MVKYLLYEINVDSCLAATRHTKEQHTIGLFEFFEDFGFSYLLVLIEGRKRLGCDELAGKSADFLGLFHEDPFFDQGKQVLYLLPEIALTTQIVDRLAHTFSEDIGVYHSKMSNNQRVELWQAVMDGKGLVLGARSSVFLPFTNLGLIIVDEEHDSSYKQSDPAPRYNGRDTAVYLAGMTKACLLYTSPSPRDQRGSRMPSSA